MSLALIPPHVLDAERRFQASRRRFLAQSGLFVVGLAARPDGLAFAAAAQAPALAPGPYPDRDFRQLDSWIVIRPDNTVTLFAGKTDLGQGTGTAFRQLLADELDVAFAQTSVVMGSTDITVDQGGSGGSDALQVDGWPMRRVAAEARRVLLDMAAPRLGVPATELTVRDGVVSTRATPPATVTYGELIGGRQFNVTLEGRNVDATSGQARVKPVSALRHVGQSPPRYDIPAKVDGSLTWAVDVTLPGMVHARNVRPPLAGATLVSVDEASVRGLPGFVRVVSHGNYVAVVFEREEQAIRARPSAQVRVAAAGHRAAARFGTALRLHAGGHAHVERHADRGRRSRVRAARRGDDRRGPLRGPVPGPHRDRPGARHRRSHRRPADHLLERHEVVRAAQRRRRVPADAARPGSRGVDGRSAGLRAHRRRRRRLRGGAAGHRDRPAGAAAVDARRRNGLGYEGPGLRRRHARRARRRRPPGRARLRRPGRGPQPSRLQRARHGAGRAVDGAAKGDAGARPGLDAVGHVRRAAPAPDHARGRAPARLGDAGPHRQPARPRRAAGDVRVRVVHRRARRRGQDRSGGVPAPVAGWRHRGRRRLPAGALDCRARCGAEGLGLGRQAVAEAAAPTATSSPAAGWPTPSAARPWSRRSSRSRSTAAPGGCGPDGSSAPTTADWSSIPRRCAGRSSAACCTR